MIKMLKIPCLISEKKFNRINLSLKNKSKRKINKTILSSKDKSLLLKKRELILLGFYCHLNNKESLKRLFKLL